MDLEKINIKSEPKYKIKIQNSPERFQLRYGGHLMVRNVESSPDPRVEGFYPDKWQRKLLDYIDQKKSILVVAPTSSGKTFVAYYAIKQILSFNKTARSGNEKKLAIYVAPNKALVNQAAGDIYKRFRNVFGELTNDYSNNFFDCEVLITLPNKLEDILTNVSFKDYAQRISIVIIDEVHCLADPEIGHFYQRAISLLKCPFVALSATVGKPEKFRSWLQSLIRCENDLEEFKDSKVKETVKENYKIVELVTNNERWSDIEKRIFNSENLGILDVKKDNLINSLGNKNYQNSLHKLHPIVVLSLRLTEASKEAFVKDTKLTTEETLSLFEAMEKAAETFLAEEKISNNEMIEKERRKIMKGFLEKLKPENFFSSLIYISKNDANIYSIKVLEEFSIWLGSSILFEFADSVIKNLSSRSLEKNNSSLLLQKKELDQNPQNENNKEKLKIDKLNDNEKKGEEKKSLSLTNNFDSNFLIKNFLHLLLSLSSKKMLPALVFCLDRFMCEKLLKSTVEVLEEMERDQLSSERSSNDFKKKAREEERARKALKRLRDKEETLKKMQDEDPFDLEAQEQAAMEDDPNFIDPRFSFVKPGESMAADDLKFWLERAKKKYNWGRSHIMVRAVFRGIGVHHEGLTKGYKHLVETLFRNKHIRIVICTGSLAMGVNMPCRSTVFAGDSDELTPVTYRQMMGRAGRRGYDNIGYVVFYGVPLNKTVALMASKVGEIKGHSIISVVGILKLLSLDFDFKKSFYFESFERKLYFRESVDFLINMGLLNKSLEPLGLWRIAFYLEEFKGAAFVFINILKSGILHEISKDFNEDRNGFEKSKNLLRILSLLFLRKPIPEDNQFRKEELTRTKLYLDFLNSSDSKANNKENNSDEKIMEIILKYNHFVSECFSASLKTDSLKEAVPKFEIYFKSNCPYLVNSYIVDFYTHGSYFTTIKENFFGQELWQHLKKWSLLLKNLVTAFCEYMNGGFKRNEKKLSILEKSKDLEDDLMNNLFYLNGNFQILFEKIGQQTHS